MSSRWAHPRPTIAVGCYLVAVLLAVGMGCDKPSDGTSQSSQGASTTPKVSEYNYSATAAKVRKLISAGSHQAAETLLDASLPNAPDDAGLYVQYAVVLAWRENPGLSIPINQAGSTREWYDFADGIYDLLTLAIQFDPSCRTTAVEQVIAAVYERAKAQYDRDGGWIEGGHSRPFLDAAWVAARFDPEVGKRWAPKFTELKPACINRGKVFETFRLSHLVGSLNKSPGIDMFKTVNADLLVALSKRKAAGLPELTEITRSELDEGLQWNFRKYFKGWGEKDDSNFSEVMRFTKRP